MIVIVCLQGKCCPNILLILEGKEVDQNRYTYLTKINYQNYDYFINDK